MSYLQGEGMPLFLLNRLLSSELPLASDARGDVLRRCIKALTQYSLIKLDLGKTESSLAYTSMHRLLQEILRLRLEDEGISFMFKA